ncbi:hypothetical protein UlMin_004683, partial [Ulmus minor]
MAASKLFVFSILALTVTFAEVPQLRNEGGSSPETSDSAVNGEFELLKSRIAFLESNIEESNREFMKKEETIVQLQKIIQENADIVASLQSDRESLKLHNVNNEQETRIHEAECVLQVAEKELMNAEVETALISQGLMTVHEGRLPHWLLVHLVHFQLYMVSYWNEHGKPAMNLSIQKDWFPIMKEQWLACKTSLELHIHLLIVKAVYVYHESKSLMVPHASNVLKVICSYAQEAKTLSMSCINQIAMLTISLLDKVYVALKPYAVEVLPGCRKLITSSSFYLHQDWLPIMKEQWLACKTSLEPHIHLLTVKAVYVYHVSKSLIVPHASKVLKVICSFAQEAKTLSPSYMHKIAMLTRSLLDKVYVALKPYALEVLHRFRKLIACSSFYHHQVQEMLKNHELIRPLANMELAWFVASALLAMPCLFLFLLCSSIFRKRVSHARRRRTQTHFEKCHTS